MARDMEESSSEESEGGLPAPEQLPPVLEEEVGSEDDGKSEKSDDADKSEKSVSDNSYEQVSVPAQDKK